MLVSAISLDTFDSPAHEGEIILDEDYYDRHIEHQDEHLTKEQIRDVVENPDNVYRGTNTRGKTIYVWEKVVGGVTYYVRAENFDESASIPLTGIHIRTGYEDTADKIEDLKEAYNLVKIWSG